MDSLSGRNLCLPVQGRLRARGGPRGGHPDARGAGPAYPKRKGDRCASTRKQARPRPSGGDTRGRSATRGFGGGVRRAVSHARAVVARRGLKVARQPQQPH